MIDVRNEIHVRLYMIPDDLRRIADDMEKKWSKLRIGESAETETLYGNGTVVHIIVDQDRMPKR